MFELANIFKAVYHTFYHTSFSQHDFIIDTHQFILHVFSYFGNKLYAIKKKLLKNRIFNHISLIAIKFAEKVFTKFYEQVFIVVGHVSFGKLKTDNFCFIVDNDMQF